LKEDAMPQLVSVLGLIAMGGLAWLLSERRRKQNLRLIISGIGLQLIFALLILKTQAGQWLFGKIRLVVEGLVNCSNAGAAFVFGEGFTEHYFAFSVLPTVIFISCLMSVLFYLGVLQKVVEFMAKIMVWVMDVSGSESLAAAANVFIGQNEAPLVIRPYIQTMTRSEIMAMMTGGMATISGATLAAYAGMGADPGHLVTASIISAPASLVIAKIMVPELEESLTKGVVRAVVPREAENILDAACRGAADGAMLAVSIAAMLIAFIALVALFNAVLGLFPDIAGQPLTLERILGWLCCPLAWLLGVEWADAPTVGMLIGQKTILNEFVAYMHMGQIKETMSERSFTIATYALCGFSNFSSIAIQIGGVGGLVPQRRKDMAQLGLKAMIAGSLACFMTAAVAGMLIE
jgi:CNT family concentrative nucleoside transporter